MPPAARVTDVHVCPTGTPGELLRTPDPRTVVTIDGLRAAYVTTPATPCAPGLNMVVTGSSKVNINGQPAARIGDLTAHGSIITTGCRRVNIG